jgi:Protein of unknown function (DUF559)
MPKGVYIKKPGVHGKYVRTPEIRARIADGVRDIVRANAQDPEWRRRVSDGTKKRMHDPDVREKHLAGLEQARRNSPTGSSWPGGRGHAPTQTMLNFASILCPAGYLMDEVNVVTGKGHGHHYTLDFAHPEAKVNIEIDGATHKHKTESDATRDSFMRSAGWKVIRIKLWA